MIENMDSWLVLSFILIWVSTIGLFYLSNGKSKKLILFVLLWSIIQSIIAYSGFYQITDTMPPRLALILVPNILFIVYGLQKKQLDWMMKNRDIRFSTFLHTIRIPVELVLFQLFLNKLIPEIMTFEGSNFDIIMGISAPIIGMLFLKNKIGKRGLIVWNVVGLILIFTILFIATLSIETPFQQFGFEQSNKAIIYFPFILLAVCIVPIVIYTHITDIIKLSRI